MSEVTLKINGRGYSLACDAGQEQRLTDLSYYVDSRLRDIANAGAATNDSHLLVLTSLVLADEVFELRDQMSAMNSHLEQLKLGQQQVQEPSSGVEEEELIAQAITHLAEKIERISSRLNALDEEAAA